MALADAGERAEVREAEPRRGREGAHGGFEGYSGSLVVAARHVRFSRGASSSLKGHLSFAFNLFELDEERHHNHAHGDNLAVLDGQLA
jgi:hypothetical protein